MSSKYIDRKVSSRLSLSRSTSPSLLPPIHRKPDSFSLSVKRHLTDNHINPEITPHSVRYYLEEPFQLSPLKENPKISQVLSARRKSLSGQTQQSSRYQYPAYIKERPDSEVYEERVEENVKRYGRGMLRNRHLNILSISSKQGDLLQLHYRLKKQREKDIILKEEREAKRRFKELLSRYESL